MTPSDFELNSHPEFAKTYAYHLEISANRRPPMEKNHGFFMRGDHTDIICQFAALYYGEKQTNGCKSKNSLFQAAMRHRDFQDRFERFFFVPRHKNREAIMSSIRLSPLAVFAKRLFVIPPCQSKRLFIASTVMSASLYPPSEPT